MSEDYNEKRKGDFYMHSINMWEIFINTGNIEAYLYDKINRAIIQQCYSTGLKEAILAVTAPKEKDGTEG
jgi:hypothetical protein